MTIDDDELLNRFTYHAPSNAQAGQYQQLREAALAFARQITRLTPESREQSAALTHLDAAVMFANAAIARRT